MKYDTFIRESVKQNLSGFHVSQQQQTRIINGILEGKKMNKRHSISIVLIAAIVVVLLAGTAFAASRLGLLDLFAKYAEPITQLEDADKYVALDLGKSENDWVAMNIEEATFDGQGVMVQLSFTPKDTKSTALRSVLLDINEEEYDVRRVESEDNSTLIYYTGRKDEKTDIICSADVVVANENGDMIRVAAKDAQMREDGSVILRYIGVAREPLSGKATMQITPHILLAGEWNDVLGNVETTPMEIDSIRVEMKQIEITHSVKLLPIENIENSRFEILSSNIRYTPILGYLTIQFAYAPSEEDDMGIWFDPVDMHGEPIATIDGRQIPNGNDELGREIWVQTLAIQPEDKLPERFWLETWLDDEDNMRIECEIVEE